MLFQSPYFEVDMLTSPEDILLNVYYMVLITLFYHRNKQIFIYKEQMFPHCINEYILFNTRTDQAYTAWTVKFVLNLVLSTLFLPIKWSKTPHLSIKTWNLVFSTILWIKRGSATPKLINKKRVDQIQDKIDRLGGTLQLGWHSSRVKTEELHHSLELLK